MGNHRHSLTEESLGIPVIAVGVPTVVAAAAIVYDTVDALSELLEAAGASSAADAVEGMRMDERYQMVRELIEPRFGPMYVTPGNIDERVKRLSFTISELSLIHIFLDGGPGFLFSVFEPFSAEFKIRFQTDLFAELYDLICAELVGDELRLDVPAAFFLKLEVEKDQVVDIFIELPFFIKLHHRNAETFVEDSRTPSGAVRMMAVVYHKGNQLSFIKNRLYQGNVRKMRAAAGIRIIGDVDIPVVYL